MSEPDREQEALIVRLNDTICDLHHTTRCEITLRRAQTSVITEYNSLTLWQKIKFAFDKKGLRNYEQSNHS